MCHVQAVLMRRIAQAEGGIGSAWGASRLGIRDTRALPHAALNGSLHAQGTGGRSGGEGQAGGPRTTVGYLGVLDEWGLAVVRMSSGAVVVTLTQDLVRSTAAGASRFASLPSLAPTLSPTRPQHTRTRTLSGTESCTLVRRRPASWDRDAAPRTGRCRNPHRGLDLRHSCRAPPAPIPPGL
jgi:hypothetical protein